MTISVVYVAYRTPVEMLLRSIESVRTAAFHAGIEVDVTVVDNGGVSSYSDRLASVRIIGTGVNIGFGRAVNLALQSVHGDRLLLMNPDSVVREDLLRELERARSLARPGTMFGALLLKNGRPQVHAYNLWWGSIGLLLHKRRWATRLEKSRIAGAPVAVARLCGAGWYAARDDLKALGAFDESFFLYGEDVDLSLRALQAGHPLVLVPRAVIEHDAGTSSEASTGFVERAQTDAHLRLLAKHRSRAISLAGRVEVICAALAGSIMTKDARLRAARLARLEEVRRWGLRKMAPPFDPSASDL